VNGQTFIAALDRLEREGDVDGIARLFAPDAELWNPRLSTPARGADGARRFWQEYRAAFATIHSQFRSVIETPTQAALEWESSGEMRVDGHPFRYRGVSVLEWSDDVIRRFAAYFDPAPLTATHPATSPAARA
jgi:ketosteroid isomerase-like protein